MQAKTQAAIAAEMHRGWQVYRCRQADKELGQVAGITAGCKARRQAAIEAGMLKDRHVKRHPGRQIIRLRCRRYVILSVKEADRH
jgi:hypothetical protein